LPGATGLTSYLSGCFLSQASGAVFRIAGVLEEPFTPCLGCAPFPLRALALSRLSASFLAGLLAKAA